jgi:hypothetical protein
LPRQQVRNNLLGLGECSAALAAYLASPLIRRLRPHNQWRKEILALGVRRKSLGVEPMAWSLPMLNGNFLALELKKRYVGVKP